MPARTVVVLAADTRYAGPLAVTLQSINDTLRDNECVEAVVLATGIDKELRSRITANLTRVVARWVDVDVGQFQHLPAKWHISRAAYSRFLMDRFVGEDQEVAVYLDTDIVVRRSICDLVATPLDGALFGACIDLFVLRVGSPYGVFDWHELGLDPTAPYANAGILVANLKRWRDEQFGQVMLRYNEERGNRVRFMNQDALNACGYGRWKLLDLRWNVQPTGWEYSRNSWTTALVRQDELSRIYADPWLVHYVGSCKPWLPRWESVPLADLWWQVAERTDFRFRTRAWLAQQAMRQVGRSAMEAVRGPFQGIRR